jgi:CRISPR-associated protein Csx16
MPLRLVSFLGTGEYKETTYIWHREEGARECRTQFIARALAEMATASEVVILPTKDAWQKYGQDFRKQLGSFGLKEPEDSFLALGATPAELWQQFECVKRALRAETGTKVVLDITHGFRSSPFFAAAAVAFTRLVDPSLNELEVVYGAFEARDKDNNITPIWDITPFVELLDWSRSLMLFLRTGRAAELAIAVESLGRALRKAWNLGGRQGPKPGIDNLAKALERFGNDIETVRTGAILLGRPPKDPSAVSQLLSELQRSKEDLPQHIPPLADVLDRLRATVEALRTDQRLSQPDGQRALKALAGFYLEMGRYPEAAATIREAWINQHACSKADCPGFPEFSDEHREAAEKAWYAANEKLAGEIAETRNDIQHAGYRNRPQPAETIKRKIAELINKLDFGKEESDA